MHEEITRAPDILFWAQLNPGDEMLSVGQIFMFRPHPLIKALTVAGLRPGRVILAARN